MDIVEFRQRLAGARAHAATRHLEAVEMLAANLDLRRENDEAFARQRARQLAVDRHVDAESDAIRSTDAER